MRCLYPGLIRLWRGLLHVFTPGGVQNEKFLSLVDWGYIQRMGYDYAELKRIHLKLLDMRAYGIDDLPVFMREMEELITSLLAETDKKSVYTEVFRDRVGV